MHALAQVRRGAGGGFVGRHAGESGVSAKIAGVMPYCAKNEPCSARSTTMAPSADFANCTIRSGLGAFAAASVSARPKPIR